MIYLLAGVYADTRILLLALLLVPSMLIGTAVGRRVSLSMSRASFFRILSIIVLCAGAMLVVRYFAN